MPACECTSECICVCVSSVCMSLCVSTPFLVYREHTDTVRTGSVIREAWEAGEMASLYFKAFTIIVSGEN